jgi:hypothetical protein
LLCTSHKLSRALLSSLSRQANSDKSLKGRLLLFPLGFIGKALAAFFLIAKGFRILGNSGYWVIRDIGRIRLLFDLN